MNRFALVGLIMTLSYSLMPSSMASDLNPYGGVKVAPPSLTEIILTIQKGKVIKKLSMKDLMAMKSEKITVNEPFVKKVQNFRAIPLKNLFVLAGIKGSDKVETIALNDYTYTNSAINFISAEGYLAISRSERAIGFDQGGPIRIIFPDKSKWARFLDPWNWSLKSLKVK